MISSRNTSFLLSRMSWDPDRDHVVAQLDFFDAVLFSSAISSRVSAESAFASTFLLNSISLERIFSTDPCPQYLIDPW